MNLQVHPTDPMLVPEMVDNPADYAERIVQPLQRVMRALRQDPLGQMAARHQIGAVELEAGRRWQRDYEAAGPRLKSSGHLEEPVDGSRPPASGITDRQMRARERLEFYRALVGKNHYAVLEAVLADKLSIWGVVARLKPHDLSPAWRRFYGTLFRELLAQLAKVMGLAGTGPV